MKFAILCTTVAILTVAACKKADQEPLSPLYKSMAGLWGGEYSFTSAGTPNNYFFAALLRIDGTCRFYYVTNPNYDTTSASWKAEGTYTFKDIIINGGKKIQATSIHEEIDTNDPNPTVRTVTGLIDTNFNHFQGTIPSLTDGTFFLNKQ